ncbi:metal-dependent hydrolase [Pantoea sp. Nvir]|uniref:metal-dependent hydrolase n=1 Tax=Pantoea sp. Nvir TaxID=2576760 RepID=UPI00135BEFED|nr:metal-dependent hydrolase [Pantoea sp. Nvir]MXP66251.1 metal-dependent hydrolase [Pantoea sp. Nvir]CAJ0991563.1 putative metal-dependent hydrolase YcfH [Pantoea sp. Nvir]
MFLVDSHCHIDALNYQKNNLDLDAVIDQAIACDVKFMLAIATTIPGFHALKALVGDRNNIALSVGVHPLNQEEPYDFKEFRRLATDSRVVALGETGIDYHYQQETKAQQQASFREHIRTGIALNKPVIIHTRNAREDTLSILREEQVEICGGVLHCFTEDKRTAAKLLDMGLYVSFSGIITFNNAEQLREAVRYVPLDRILVETDSPYLAPVPYRGKENQPAYTRDIAEYLAVLKCVDIETLAAATTQNFSTLFHIPESRLGV